MLKITNGKAGLGQTVINRVLGKREIMLLASEAFFLSSRNDSAINHQGRGRVVIIRRDAKNCRHLCLQRRRRMESKFEKSVTETGT